MKVVKNFDHLSKIKFSPHLPKAFTEKGLYMLATILKGSRAAQTTIFEEAANKVIEIRGERRINRCLSPFSLNYEHDQLEVLEKV